MLPEIKTSFRARLAVTTALATMTMGYGLRPVNAGVCTGAGGTYSCYGTANSGTDATVTRTAAGALSVTTDPGFGIDTRVNYGDAFYLTGNGGLSFTDNNASTISSEGSAIDTRNYSSGELSITTNGTIDAGRTGIQAYNYSGTTNLSVSAGTVTATTGAVRVNNDGSGTTNVTITGTATSDVTRAVYVQGGNSSSDLSVTTAAVSGERGGIGVSHGGTGNVVITASGDISAARGAGINVYGYNNTGNVTINAGNISSFTSGIYANNSGYGDLDITTTGNVSSSRSTGISASVGNNAGQLNINASGDVTGLGDGISARAYGSGVHQITVSGNVTGNRRTGIYTYAGGGTGRFEVTLDAGANVTANGGAGTAIGNDASSAIVTVNSGASINGAISLGDSTDRITFSGGDFSGVTQFDGGSGYDRLTFTNGSGALDASNVINIECFEVGSGGDISVSGTLTAAVEVGTGGTLSAGASPGLLTIVGNLDLGVGATTLAELGGTEAGIDYDQIDVSDDPATTGTVEGVASLASGTIFDIDWFGAFTASIGDAFDLLVADTITVGDLNLVSFDFSDAVLSGGSWQTSIVNLDGGRQALRASVVSEPGSLAILGLGIGGLYALRRRRKKAA